MNVSDRVDSVKGIGEKTKQLFEKLGVQTVGQLLTYYPREYETFLPPGAIAGCREGTMGVIEASLSQITETGKRGGMTVLTCVAKDPSGTLPLIWFNQPYLKSTLHMGYRYILRGRITRRGSNLVMEQPKLYRREEYSHLQRVLQPVYPLTKGLTNHMIGKSVKQALALSEGLPEYLPDKVRRTFGLMKKRAALEEVHFPKSRETMQEARRMLAFEEFYLFSVVLQEMAGEQKNRQSTFVFHSVPECEQLERELPFRLTDDQKTVWAEIQSDLESGKRMVRLVQGDVGSGKTILAVLALLMTIKNGCQGCLMVPTEVLAKQHYESLIALLSGYGVRVSLLVGSMTAKEKKQVHEAMRTKETDLIVGTHALIQEKAEYARLGLVITDEQHRFGVKQRERLAGKSTQPHILVMSATPIPRTLAMMLYGDMDISVIHQLPADRLPIKNCVVGTDYRQTAYRFLAGQVQEGRQVYVICPMVAESEAMDAENVTDYTERLREQLGNEITIEMLHGKMKAEQKKEVMERFSTGEVQILVSTTVVEVGVNVPNASVILIENAERFGLAQLHQLRGRVGRGSHQSYCIMMTGNTSEETMERLNILKNSNDGFFVAAEDLRLRGPGEFLGIRQSGEMGFKIGDIYQDASVLKEASEAARQLTAEERRELLTRMDANGANDVFLFWNAYSTI